MSKLSDALKNHKIDARRVVLASKALERRTAADHALVAKKAAMKAGKIEKDETVLKSKPRSGRPVTLPQIEKALRGETVSGPTKTRVVRAVNAILAARNKPEVGFRDLF
ncbi:MAG: hypothetical protein OHK0013_34150 [Sandaracinaceae bacterium]